MLFKKLKLILLSLLIALPGWAADKVVFTMEAPQVVELGEQFRLAFSVNANGQNLKLPNLSDFDVLMGPSTSQSTSFQIINGVSSQSVSYSYLYVLRAKKEGRFTINPGSITVDGTEYTSNSQSIEVVKGSAKPSTGGVDEPTSTPGTVSKKDLFVRMNLDRRSLYKGEHLTATIKIYSKVNLNGFEDISIPNFEGFWSQDIQLPQQISLQRETYNGEIYNVGTLKKTLLFPQQTGNITIGPVKIDCIVQQRVKRSQSMFDDFFDSFANVKATITSDPVSISVSPLPTPPTGFSGAVGKFDIRSSITAKSVRENDAITIKLDVTGNGNIKLINPPKISFPADFEVYDPKTNSNFSSSEQGLNGNITFEYLFLPRFAGTYTIPAVNFVYFDTDSKRYVTKTTEEYQIKVAKGDGSRAQTVNAVAKEDLKQIGSDIRYIKTSVSKLQVKGYTFFGSFAFYLLYIGGILTLLAIYLLNQKRIRENANVARMKNKKASKVALKRLKEASQHLHAGSNEKFYESITRAFWGYLSDKLTIPASELSREKASDELAKHEVTATIIERFVQILDTCEFARFAPGGGSAKMKELFEEATEVMSVMEKEIK
ncbi:MAG: BatD family protein [Prolixibacteraceae bacterium]|nr:BatD family protein [Prolixibacteraceae bacterium]